MDSLSEDVVRSLAQKAGGAVYLTNDQKKLSLAPEELRDLPYVVVIEPRRFLERLPPSLNFLT